MEQTVKTETKLQGEDILEVNEEEVIYIPTLKELVMFEDNIKGECTTCNSNCEYAKLFNNWFEYKIREEKPEGTNGIDYLVLVENAKTYLTAKSGRNFRYMMYRYLTQHKYHEIEELNYRTNNIIENMNINSKYIIKTYEIAIIILLIALIGSTLYTGICLKGMNYFKDIVQQNSLKPVDNYNHYVNTEYNLMKGTPKMKDYIKTLHTEALELIPSELPKVDIPKIDIPDINLDSIKELIDRLTDQVNGITGNIIDKLNGLKTWAEMVIAIVITTAILLGIIYTCIIIQNIRRISRLAKGTYKLTKNYVVKTIDRKNENEFKDIEQGTTYNEDI